MNGSRLLTAMAIYVTLGSLTPAEAHLLGTSGGGFAEGLAHPFSGLDHLLAMIAVGFWAAQSGARAILLLPLVFPAMMAVGALAGGTGFPLPAVELGVAASVVALGLLVAFGARLPLLVSAGLVGLSALLHGHSHGAEMPMAASAMGYALGFLGATLILHMIGIGGGLILNRPAIPYLARLAGSGTAAAGLVLVARLVYRCANRRGPEPQCCNGLVSYRRACSPRYSTMRLPKRVRASGLHNDFPPGSGLASRLMTWGCHANSLLIALAPARIVGTHCWPALKPRS